MSMDLDDWKDMGKVLFGFAGDRGYFWLDWLAMRYLRRGYCTHLNICRHETMQG